MIIRSKFEDVPHAGIARQLSVSLSGVKSQRGREQLRKMLTDCCEMSLDARGAVIGCVPKQSTGADCCCSEASLTSM